MAKERTTRKALMTPMQLKFVAAWAGDNTAAAKAAGYRHPKSAAGKLMKISTVRDATAAKQSEVITTSGRKLATTLTKADVIERLLKLADIPISKTRDNMSGQISALKSIAEIQGFMISKNVNLDKMLEGRTEEEMEYFAVQGYWPDKPDPEPSASDRTKETICGG